MTFVDELGSDGAFIRNGDSVVLDFERALNRPAEKLWNALVKPELLRGWLGEASIDATESGRVELRLAGPPDCFGEGAVNRARPPACPGNLDKPR